MDPIWDSFPFYMRTVQSYPRCQRLFTHGCRLRSSLTCRPVADETKLPVAREKKTSTHTGPSSSRSHVITPNYIRLKIPKTIPCSAAHNPFASGWHINTNKWRQREYRYWGSIGLKLHCHSYSILYPLLHTVIAMIYLRSHYSPFSHRP